ncbi:glycosyltransferase family 2 protein [Aquibacillus sp. 3ASR75-11]|uniref:Glycosyltransferase family 2 protein n=1 Tax=Terrihalobacillus insolitus TaxID=2950438 RepID=A0A9X3WSR3_9BACI|nr:glycosyltransferase family 2 protein [Terrihalobacillus insolitus]MDC3425132.1 glycosyltransferase family 2 protein [Terrihalobacillus insolitus]
MKKIVVFLPAYNEEDTVGEVIREVPRHLGEGLEVQVIVIDDGSSDQTVAVAKEAGADVVYSLPNNQGLGAAVRQGLKLSYEHDASIAVMIDADHEYPAKQIPELIQPILDGTADYTMGSRFKGTIQGMRIHRRYGNYLFTLLQSILLRRWIWDGQSGMRAFSRSAIKNAHIIHDYNYAQVLTLNLMRQGYRMIEVPIDYKVRTKGQSFIKFKAYMSSVLPAIIKEMRRPVNRKRKSPVALMNPKRKTS